MECITKTKKHATLFIIIIGLFLIGTVLSVGISDSPFGAYRISTPEEAAAFLEDLGWNPDVQNITVKSSVLPEEFDTVFTEYNTLQIEQKCDLRNYAGKEIIVYTVPILNYSDNTESVYATVIVHNERVIGGDIHSAKMDGFMHTLQ